MKYIYPNSRFTMKPFLYEEGALNKEGLVEPLQYYFQRKYRESGKFYQNQISSQLMKQ